MLRFTCEHIWDKTNTHMVVLMLFWNLSGTTQVSRYQKGKNQEGKTNLDLLEDTVNGSGICWAIYASLHLIPDNHANIPPLSFYRPDALPAAQPTASKHWRSEIKLWQNLFYFKCKHRTILKLVCRERSVWLIRDQAGLEMSGSRRTCHRGNCYR